MSPPTQHDYLPRLSLLILPILFVAAAIVMRDAGGPFWLSHLLDPSYFYLFDALNMVSLQTPGLIYHPGITVHLIAGLTLKLAYPLTAASDIVAAVLDNPERHLALISTVFVGLQAVMLIVAGWAVRHVTGSLVMAGLVQIAPFLSMLALKNAYHVKPEPLLVVTMLALVVVTMLALKPDELERRRRIYPIAFGLIAGFGVATKLTAAPLFLLPFFIIPPASYPLFAVAGAVSLFVFTLPVIASYPEMVSYFAQIVVSSGEYGRGPGTIIDPEKYWSSVIKLAQRPIISISILAALTGVAVARLYRSKSSSGYRRQATILLGLAVAIVVHVLVLGKQPASFYLIPSIIIAPMIFVLIGILFAQTSLAAGARRRTGNYLLGVLFVGLATGQAFAVVDEIDDLTAKRVVAQSAGIQPFSQCTQIYYYAASTPAYALYLGNHVAGQRFNEQLKAHIDRRAYWLNDFFPFEPDRLENLDGSANLHQVMDRSQCTIFRGAAGRNQFALFIRKELGDFRFDATCAVGTEAIHTRGIDCRGEFLPGATNQN